jgi:DNA polymerase-3 subunit gamma/tau
MTNLAQDTQEIWRKIIDNLEPLTTRELLKQQCTLIEFDGESARIGISSLLCQKRAI